MPRPKVCVLRTAGTNCDQETAFAFRKAGGLPDLVHINRLIQKEKRLADYQILAIPGGFTYGDDAGAGKILASELKHTLADELKLFLSKGKLIIGICNGFQVLVKSGLLPGNGALRQEASLIINDSAKFEARWVHLQSQGPGSVCVWARDLPEVIYLPVAHGEGKFFTAGAQVLERLHRNRQVVFKYCGPDGGPADYPDNPNGSQDDIAGICDETGRILGLMPHPERHVDAFQHPRHASKGRGAGGEGILIFSNGVEYARKNI